MTVSRFRYLFDRYYTRQCTPEEQQEFMLLMEQSTHDEELKHLLDELLLHADDDAGAMPDDTAANMLQQIMETKNSEPQPAPIRVMPVWKRAAIAACVLGVLALAGYKLYVKTSAVNRPVASNHAPARKEEHARLVRGDGAVIDLEQHKDAEVDVQTGVSVARKGNTLSYNSNNSITPTINTLYTNKGGTYQLVLPDGTKAWLNAASSIRFPTAFTDSTREVTIQGEVYFEIAQQASQPFIVKANTMKIAVLGTHFNVMAYEEEQNICTSLLEGAVNIISGNTVRQMKPGQQALVNREHNGISISNADVDAAIAWKEGRFEFNGNIKSIMRELARWYDVQFVYEGELTNKAFAGTFSRHDSLKDILQQLELTGSIHFNINDKTITVSP
ncbi:FecR family protein [Chitinophaga ginsengisegetis]|uniref:FecR family protein n=1 Tax=Chitinophaga ginsengisegetis TaxID=393003 RepID=A0A1T5P8U2_9BACT|nr:FecR domain-containing protein [Chitinophaga ginsengisegetis]SKD09174.1 FecR family protein [Chitinophaga ginsengisegetis]